MIKTDIVTFKMRPPENPEDRSEKIRFECQVLGCGDIVFSTRLDIHAEEAHRADTIAVDNWFEREAGAKNRR